MASANVHQCNISGLACVSANYPELSVVRPKWARRAGLPCDCPPSCTETEISVIKDEHTPHPGKSEKSEIEIVLQYLPSERFKRNVIRSRLDLVVSVGGTTGLFVGASLLSFVELIFYFTVRLWNNYWMDKDRVDRNNKAHYKGRIEQAISLEEDIRPYNFIN
ncbi:Sodium channel protein Nach [Eumeta japonica]|uniref:Sodium channel protein Nach n=1 Tax=Eumeta variegata TaxID=151549 RepID=A0A4C2A3H7_EUMVA|nr:Sodium channel protein Nach [Eumeta japonica]